MTLSQADIDSLLGPQPADSVESLLDAPVTGEDISLALQDPTFKPSAADYAKYEEYAKTRQTDWLNTIAQSVDVAAGMIGGAISQGVQGAAANPLNYIEGAAQGTRQLYGLVAQSQDPASPLFKFKDLVAGTGTPESRYQQFLEARDFANTTARLERGEEGLFVPPELTNPEFVQGVSMILDPTLALPGIGEAFGAGKLATRAVGRGAQLAGRAVTGAVAPVERLVTGAERIAGEALSVSPEALRTTAATTGIAGALGIAPEAAALAAVPAAVRTTREVGEAITRAGENLLTQPSRIGPLEAIGAAPGANMRQRMLGVIGQYGGDAALDSSLRGLAGGIEGAAVGTVLGGLSGGEEGAAAGLGTGMVQGAAGALAARGIERLTGRAAREARAGDLGRFIDAQQDPTTKALFERVRDTHGVDAASALMDVEALTKGRFGDVDVLYRSNKDFSDQFGGSARGVQVVQAERPTIVINADIIGRGQGDTPLYTLGHELFHALEKSEQLSAGATEIKDALVGRWIQEGDVTRKLAEGALTDADIEARFNQYRDKLAAGNAEAAADLARYDTINKKADYIASEIAAEHFARLIAGQQPDAMLKGFSGLTRQLMDAALTQNVSKAIANAAASIERTFGVKPTDSVLFPDLKQASPQLNAMLRDLVRARRKLDERILAEDAGPARTLKPQDVANPVAATQLVELGLAERMPDGSVRSLSDEEIRVREEKDTTTLKTILESLPGARVVDGEIQGRFSPQQLSAIEQSQAVSSRMKDKIRAVASAMDNGNSIFVNYGAATRRVKNRLTGKFSSKYSSGIRLSQREVLPYSFYLSKADNPVVKVIDLTKIRSGLERLTAPDGSIAGGLWDNVDGFMGDLAKYFTNLDAKENARRSSELFGADKARFLGDFVNEQEKGGRKFVRDLRLDRIGSTASMPFRARISEDAIQLSKLRWMPAETVGDKSVINSEEGYRIISGAKHKLYGPDGKLLGIFDTQTQAERKADATHARLQPEVDQQQRPARDEGRQAAEAGRGDRALGRTQGREEGRKELGAVRQAGDVIVPESPEVAKKVASGDTSVLRDGELLGTFRFMPPDLINKLAVTEEQRQAMQGKSGFAFVSDWADAGRPYVTQLGRKIDVLMGGMGYPFLPEISGKGAWAGTFSGMTDTVMKKIKATDGIGLVVLGGPESSASSRAFSRAFGEELADSMSQNPKLKEKLDKIARKARKQWIEYRRGEGRSIDVPEINSLEDWARLTQLERSGEQSEKGLTFKDRDFLVRTIGSHENKKALGIKSWNDVLRNYNLQNKDFSPGQVVAVVQFSGAEPVRAETVGAKVHPSYEALIPGKAIGTLPQKTMIKDVFRDFLSKTQPPAFTRKVQTNMPKFVVGEGDMRFMPSSLTARDINAIAAEVGGGDVKGGAKAFGAFMRSMRDKGITLRDVVKSYGITLSSIQRQELPVSTIKKNWPDAPFQEGTKVRPEDAFAQLLGTPEGQKYLDAAERGVFDEQAADAVVQKFRSFGFHNKLKEQMKTAVEQFYPKAQEIIDAVNTMPTDQFIDYVRNNFKGISYGKVGFWSGQLGRGDIPTFDSRQGKLVYGKEVPVTKQVLMEQKDRLTQLGIKVPAAFKDFAQTLLHHEVWDRLNQSDTEHGPIKEAMLRYMPSDTDYLSAVQKGDTQAAQRMVDEAAKAAGLGESRLNNAGNPEVMYHGSGWSAHNVFERGKSPSGGSKPYPGYGLDDIGFWFTSSKNQATEYGSVLKQEGGKRPPERLYNVFLDIKNPLEFADQNDFNDWIDSYARIYAVDETSKSLMKGGRRLVGAVNVNMLLERLKMGKKDGIIIWKGNGDKRFGLKPDESYPTWAIVFDPSQIKSADPITRDDAGNVIPLSKRFQASSEDIRFMPDYSGEHRAPGRDSGASLDNLKDVYPDDVYGPNAARYYGHESGSQTDKAAVRIIQATKGKPDAPVKVFRAIPKSIQSNEINPGDWITTIKSYAVQHGEGPLGGDYKILEKTVPAGDLYTDGNSIFEFGYDPKFMPQPDSAMPGAYSFQGGYRALPGKAKGSLRLYGPAGSLIGIAASLDEAQRIIRRKTRQ